jgi:mannitol/fructose-specific phosphotransferase system IIA component (Ntr-type)
MRNLKLTHCEISLIRMALEHSHKDILNKISELSEILPKDSFLELLKQAKKYEDLLLSIDDGEKDV